MCICFFLSFTLERASSPLSALVSRLASLSTTLDARRKSSQSTKASRLQPCVCVFLLCRLNSSSCLLASLLAAYHSSFKQHSCCLPIYALHPLLTLLTPKPPTHHVDASFTLSFVFLTLYASRFSLARVGATEALCISYLDLVDAMYTYSDHKLTNCKQTTNTATSTIRPQLTHRSMIIHFLRGRQVEQDQSISVSISVRFGCFGSVR